MSEGLFFLARLLKFDLFTNRHLSSSLIIGCNILPYILHVKGKRERERKKIERQSPQKDNDRSFSLSRNKKINLKPSSGRSQETENEISEMS